MPLRKRGTFKATIGATLGVAAMAAAMPSGASAASLLGGLFGGSTKPVATTPKPTTPKATAPTATTPTAITPVVAAPAATTPFATTTAAAAPIDSSTTCPDQPTTQAFAKIGDTADYALAPTGDFEHGLAGWTISGSGGIVSGNETLGIVPGSHSLALGGGIVSGPTTITSPQFCVDQAHPYFRYLIKANGPVGLMATYIKYTAADGSTVSSQVQSNVSTSLLPGSWKASDLNPLSINIPLVNNGGKAAKVQLIFITPGSVLGAGYNIDNVLVDPYRRG